MILCRCFAWNERSAASEPDGALHFARTFQGEGRHDNPQVFGCVYASAEEVSSVVEQLVHFRGQRLLGSMLVQRGLPLALAEIDLGANEELLDLDDPRELLARSMRPSQVATRYREVTQPQALAAYEGGAAGLRWWSTFESSWENVTLFDRASPSLRVIGVRLLGEDDPVVLSAAEALGLSA